MKQIHYCFVFGLLSLSACGQNIDTIFIKPNHPLKEGFIIRNISLNGTLVHYPSFIKIYSSYDSVFSIRSGRAIVDTNNGTYNILIGSGKKFIHFFDLRSVSVRKGNFVNAGDFIGLAKAQSSKKTFSVTITMRAKKGRLERTELEELFENLD
jgi:hypothetical protein